MTFWKTSLTAKKRPNNIFSLLSSWKPGPHPIIPGIIRMINSARKGTKKYYNLLKHHNSMANLTRDGENKWAQYIQAPLSVYLWGGKYLLTW